MPGVDLAGRTFLSADSAQTPQHVAALASFSPPAGAPPEYVTALVEDLRNTRTFTVPFNYRLRQSVLRVVAPEWEELPDEEIDLDFHFRHNALPRPGGERELGVLVGRLHSQALDPTRPLWEVHLIEGLPDHRFALYFKIHHALMDGVGGIRRFTQMVGPDPTDDNLRPLWSVGPSKKRPRAAGRHAGSPVTVARAAVGSVLGTAKLAGGLGKVAAGMVGDALRPGERDTATPFVVPKSIINGRIGQQRRVATQTYEFERVRAVATAGDVTINDVFLAICAGGLRRYLRELGELPDDGLVAGTPVSVRAAGDDDSSNAFSMTVMKLCTDVADPLERLRLINRSSTLAKEKLSTLSKPVVENYPALFMAPFVAQQPTPLAGRIRPPYNVSISNVPGPMEPQYLAGSRLESLAPIALLYHGVALFIAVMATSGRFGVGFVGCRDTLPHLQRLAVYTGEALDELEQALA